MNRMLDRYPLPPPHIDHPLVPTYRGSHATHHVAPKKSDALF